MVAKSTMGPLIGALFTSVTPKGQDKKRAGKSKGEKSVTQPKQQHGELASSAVPTSPYVEKKPPTDKQQIRQDAKYQMKRATEDWVAGRVSTDEHKAVHMRAQHVLHGKHPHEFKGKSGERKGKYL